jgi:hypothetical protein
MSQNIIPDVIREIFTNKDYITWWTYVKETIELSIRYIGSPFWELTTKNT